MVAVLIFTIAFIVMTYIGWKLHQSEKKRSEELSQLAKTLGMSFSIKVDRAFRKEAAQFGHVFRPRGKVNQYLINNLRNKMAEKHNNNTELTFFECKPVNNEGGMGTMEGVFYFKSPVASFPTFQMRPAIQIQQDLLSAFGVKAINFESHPAFSRKYLLKGGDEKKIRELFSPTLLDALEKLNDRFHIEAHKNQMVIRRSIEANPFSDSLPPKRVPIQEFRALKQQVIKIFQGFAERN